MFYSFGIFMSRFDDKFIKRRYTSDYFLMDGYRGPAGGGFVLSEIMFLITLL